MRVELAIDPRYIMKPAIGGTMRTHGVWRVMGTARWSAVVLVMCGIGSACSSADTWLVVEVSSTLRVPDEVDELEFQITGESTRASFRGSYSIATSWPHRLRVRPQRDDGEAVTIAVLANKRSPAGPIFVVRGDARDRFAAGTTRVVHVSLDAACRGVSCSPGFRCDNGVCVEIAPDGGLPDAGGPDGEVSDGQVDGEAPDGVMDDVMTDAPPTDRVIMDVSPPDAPLPERGGSSFRDDFGDGVLTGWTASGGAMSESGGVMQATGETWTHHYVTGGAGWTDCTVSVQIRAVDNDAGGLTFRVQDANNFYLLRQGFGDNDGWMLRLQRVVAGGGTDLGALDNQGGAIGQVNSTTAWYTLSVEVAAGRIRAYVDGIIKFDLADSTFASGSAGIWLADMDSTQLDAFQVDCTP